MENIKSKDGLIEICMAEKKTGQVKIRMSALKICDANETNKNLINWKREYVQNNLDTIIGSDYVVSFLNGMDGIPSSHGEIDRDEDGKVIFKNSVIVGHIEEAKIETVNIDGEEIEVLMTTGWLNRQRFPKFVRWLKEEIENGRVCGSIEINPRPNQTSIIYEQDVITDENGNLIFRTPKTFSFTGLAILCKEISEPADDNSIVFSVELNTKQNVTDETVSDNKTEKGDSTMNQEQFEKQIAELNTQLTGVNEKITELNSVVVEKDAKIAELNEVVVEANKTQEELNSKIEAMTKELENCKAELQAYKDKEAQAQAEAKKAEVNAYMENEVSKNGFTDAEINSFKELIEACDLEGIKKLESELCTAKFKAEINARKEVEANSNQETKEVETCSMFTIKEKEKVIIGDEMPTLF